MAAVYKLPRFLLLYLPEHLAAASTSRSPPSLAYPRFCSGVFRNGNSSPACSETSTPARGYLRNTRRRRQTSETTEQRGYAWLVWMVEVRLDFFMAPLAILNISEREPGWFYISRLADYYRYLVAWTEFICWKLRG